MFDGLLVFVAVLSATTSLRELRRLDRLAREFKEYAQARNEGSIDVLSAMVDHQDLDKHQRILTTEATAALGGLLLSFLCLLGVVIVSW